MDIAKELNRSAGMLSCCVNVGMLLDFISEHKIPRESKILIQRIEDVYFEKHGWTTIKKESENWHSAKMWNEEIESGKYLDKTKYPDMNSETLKKYTDIELESFKDEYIVVFSPVKYKNDNNLYLDAHY